MLSTAIAGMRIISQAMTLKKLAVITDLTLFSDAKYAAGFQRRNMRGMDMSEFKPDWDVKEAALDSLREHMAIARDLKAKNEQLQATNQQLLGALEEIKANHADVVLRNAVLRQRPDLPVDRIPAIKRYEEKIENSRISGMREMFEWLKSQGLVMNLGYRDGEDFINRQAITSAKQVGEE